MNAEDTIRNLYETYNYHRTRALDQLFFTNGNGYEWIDGELVGIFEEVTPETITENAIIHKKKFSDYLMECYEKDYIRFAKYGEGMSPFSLPPKERLAQYWAEEEENRDKPFETYLHLTKYDAIANIPDDVKPDWLTLAIEACEWALSLDSELVGTGCYSDTPNSVYQEKVKEYREDIKRRFNI